MASGGKIAIWPSGGKEAEEPMKESLSDRRLSSGCGIRVGGDATDSDELPHRLATTGRSPRKEIATSERGDPESAEKKRR